MNIPELITQGETRVWKDGDLVDDLNAALTAPTWTLTYALRGASAVNGKYGVDLVAVADGGGFKTTITTVQSADLMGTYDWVAYVQQGADATTRIMVGKGRITVLQNIALVNPASTAYDGRTQVQKNLDAIDETLAARSRGEVPKSYTIGTRSLENESVVDLMKLREHWQRLRVKERQRDAIKNGEGDPRSVVMRFRSPF